MTRAIAWSRRWSMRRRAVVVSLAACIAVPLVLLLTRLPAGAAATDWPAEAALQVSAVTVDGAGDPVGVTVSWPDPQGPVDSFDVFRDGVKVTSVAGGVRSATDATPDGAATRTYTVVALDAGTPGPALGSPDVQFPDAGTGCTLVWTGGASNAWDDARNWAPYGEAGSEGPARAPTATDHVCVDHGQNLPVTVATAGAGAARFTGSVFRPESLRVETGGDLKVFGAATIPAIQMAGGTLHLQGDTDLLRASGRPELSLGGGTLMIDTTVSVILTSTGTISGEVVALDGTTTTIDGGELRVQTLALDSGGAKTVEGRGGHQTTLTTDAEFTGTTNLTVGPGGATLVTDQVEVDGGTTTIDWAVDAPPGDTMFLNSDGGRMVVNDLVELGPGDETFERGEIDLRGEVVLGESLEVLGGELAVQDVGGSLKTGGRATDFAGLREVDALTVREPASVTIDGDFTVDDTDLSDGAVLDVAGTILDGAGTENFVRLDEATVRTGRPWTVVPDWTVQIGEVVVFEGDVIVEGHVIAAETIDAVGYADAVWHDDLTFEDTGKLSLGAEGNANDEYSGLRVEGTLTLDGELDIEVVRDLPDGTDVIVIETTTPPVDDWDTVTLRGDGAGTAGTENDDDGIHLTSGDGPEPEPCVAIADVNHMAVDGCWNERLPRVYVSNDGLIVDPDDVPRIGGVTFDPDPGVDLVLDASAPVPTLIGEGPGGTGRVDVSTTFVPPGGAAEDIPLGNVALDWTLDDRPFPVFPDDDVFGLPFAEDPTLAAGVGAWTLRVNGVLPDLVGARSAALSATVDGRGFEDIASPPRPLVLAGVAKVDDVRASYDGLNTWRLTSPGGPVGVNGTITYTDGAPVDATLAVTDFSVGGFGQRDATLSYAGALGEWTSSEVGGDGQPLFAIDEDGLGGVSVGSRLALGETELGVATLGDDLRLVLGGAGWTLEGTARHAEGTTPLANPTPLVFDDGALIASDVVFAGSYGTLAVLEDLTLSIDPNQDRPGDGKSGAVYDVSAAVQSGATRDSTTGTLAVGDGELSHLELPLELSLGQIARIDGTLGYDEDSGEFPIGGADPSEPAVVTCGRESYEAGSDAVLAGGDPTSGGLTLEALCLGPVRVEALDLDFGDSEGGLSAKLGGRDVEGRLDLMSGDVRGGFIGLPALTIGGLFQIPTADLVFDPSGGVLDRFVLDPAPAPADILQGFELAFDGGDLAGGRLALGDPSSASDDAPRVADAGGWLPIGGVEVEYDVPRETWSVDGFLDEPAVDFGGTLDLDNGAFTGGSLSINGANLGSLAQLDLDLTVSGAQRFDVEADLVGAGFPGSQTAAGSLTFADGALAQGSLEIDEFPIGDFLRLEDFRLAFDEPLGTWGLGGTVMTDLDPAIPSEVDGSFTFTDGVLTAASLDLGNVPVGPSVIERLSFDLDRSPGDGPRAEDYGIDGVVRGPRQSGESAELTRITGRAAIEDGTLTHLNLTIPHLELPGLAYIDDVALGYTKTGDRADLTGAGTLHTADEAGPSAATVAVALDDGVVDAVEIGAARLGLGRLVVVDAFEALYDRTAETTCAGEDRGTRGLRIYSLSGIVDGTAMDGCLGLIGRRLVGGELSIADLDVGELFTIQDLEATFAANETYNVPLADTAGSNVPGGADLTRTTLDIDATITAGDNDPLDVTGSMEVTDGGLSALSLGIGDLPLSATVSLQGVAVTYVQSGRWDGVPDTFFRVSGSAVHDGGTTGLDGSLSFDAFGALDLADLTVSGLPLGPVTLDELAFLYEQGGGTTQWDLGGQVTVPGGSPFAVDGAATIDDGRIQAASLRVPRLSIGELVLLSNSIFDFTRKSDGSEAWSATTSVLGQGQSTDPATGAIDVVIGADGRLERGTVAVDHVRWGGMLTVTDLDLSGSREPDGTFRWDLDALLAVGGGAPSDVSGSLVIEDGVVMEGSLTLLDVRIDELATIDRLDLAASRNGVTTWAATLHVTPADGAPVAGSGSMSWNSGRLDSASLELGGLPVAELFVLDNFALDYESGTQWAVSGRLSDEDGQTAFGGELLFTDGLVTGGQLALDGLQIGPLQFSSFLLDIEGIGGTGPAVCGVADPGGLGTRYAVDATLRSADGDTTTLGGRLRLRDGAFTDGVLCGDGIQVADMILLDDAVLAYSLDATGPQRTIGFDGAATVRNPDEPGDPFSADFSFSIENRVLQQVSLDATGLNLGDLMTLEDVSLGFDRGINAADWAFGATLKRGAGAGSTIGGALQVRDGTIVGGNLDVASLPVGDLLTIQDLQIDFFGRRSTSTRPQFAGSGATSDCAAVPADPVNTPSGVPGVAGGESVFALSATVEANDDTFAASGLLTFADGKLNLFDVSVACLPLGDFRTLEGLRVARTPSNFRFSARLQDDEGTSSAGGSLVFDDGRLSGGELTILDLPLGIVEIDTFELALGENIAGDTVFGITAIVEDDDGSTYGGGGSLTMRDGRVVAGTLDIAELPFLDLFTIEDLSIEVDGSVPGQFRFAGGADIVLGGGGSGGLDIELTFQNGRIVQGAFAAEQVDLFEVVPLGGFSISYDSTTSPPSWSGSMEASLPGLGGGSGPGIQLGVEFQRGRLVSGVFGFDANGDGEVDGLNADGSAPASGGGDFTGLPLKALYIRYCAPNSNAAFCDPIDADTWEGRIGFELPTDGAPGLDASIRLRNGKFEAASVTVSGLSIPIYPGVFLNLLGASIELNPRLLFEGQVGVTVGLPGGSFDIVEILATFGFSEEPEPDPGLPPEAYEPEYLRFFVEGDATLLELPIALESFVEVETRGYVGVGGSIDFDIIDGVLYVNGGTSGSVVFDATSMGLIHPRTGEPLTGPHAQVRGFAAAGILGHDVVSAEVVANSIGLAGCAGIDVVLAEIRIGAGIYWSDGSTKLTCDLGRFEIVDFGSAGATSAHGASRVGAAADEATFIVPAGEDVLGVEVLGDGGAPDVVLVAPDGTVYDEDDDDPSDDGVLIATSDDKRWFVIGDPQAGEWRVEAAPGSVPPIEVAVSLALPPVDVSGAVSGPAADGTFTIDYSLTEIDGQDVFFEERSTDPDDGYSAVVGPATAGSGEVVFTPGGSATGGEREIVAHVLQDGFGREVVVLDTFVAPDATPAGPPQSVGVAEVASGARVTWAAPVSSGGRPVTAYRISSNAGWSVTVGPDARTADLPIPAMVPGESVPVLVQAGTGLGWGTPATAFFTSTQTTGFQYAQGEIPTTDSPDLGPIDAPPGPGDGDPGSGGDGSPGDGSSGGGPATDAPSGSPTSGGDGAPGSGAGGPDAAGGDDLPATNGHGGDLPATNGHHPDGSDGSDSGEGADTGDEQAAAGSGADGPGTPWTLWGLALAFTGMLTAVVAHARRSAASRGAGGET